MKKNLFIFASAVTLLFAFNSCKSDNLDLDKELKFSTQSIEQQKQTIEQNGIELTNKVDGLKDAKAMLALESLSSKTSTGVKAFVNPLVQLRTGLLKNNVNSVETFSKQMRTAAVNEQNWGVYTWNFATHDFDFVAGKNTTLTYLFPATENSKTNNGELKITYVESKILAPESTEYMPENITAVLKVDNSVVMKAEFSGKYKSDATPTKLIQTLEIEKYNWKFEFTNDDKDISAKYEFKLNTEVLVKFEVGAAGSFTATNIENSMNNENPENILSSGAVYFQVMNIAFLGGIKDFKGFIAESKNLTPADTEAYYQTEANLLNKYVIMYGYFVKEKRKFAEVEFYVYDDPYTFTDWNGQTVTTHNYSTEPRFVLSDKSAVSIEEYVQTGFEDLIKKLQEYQGK